MLLPHFKRTNLCAHGTPALTHMAGAFPDPRERMMDMVESFVQRQNVKHYTRQLMTESDTNKREILQKLLAEEIVKQASGALLQT